MTGTSSKLSYLSDKRVLCLIVLGGAFMFTLGFATNGWLGTDIEYNGVKGSHYIGLWRDCVCGKVNHDLREEGWFRAAQALATIALIIYMICLVASVLLLFISMNRILTIVIIVCTSGTTFFSLISLIVVGENTNVGMYGKFSPQFSFGFVCLSLIFNVPIIVVSVLFLKNNS